MQKPIMILLMALLVFGTVALAQSTTSTTTTTTTSATAAIAPVAGDAVLPTTLCSPADALEQKAMDCKAAGKFYQRAASTITNSDGTTSACLTIECTDKPACPTDAMIQNYIHACRDNHGTPQDYTDAYGCKQISCSSTANPVAVPVTGVVNTTANVYCKKYTDGGKTMIVCSDGTQITASDNTCSMTSAHTEPTRTPQCTVAQDESGCMVKKCTDGYVARSCPTEPPKPTNPTTPATTPTLKPTTCVMGTDPQGNQVKKCENGFYVNYGDLKTYCAKAGVDFSLDNLTQSVKCPYGDNGEYVAEVTSNTKRNECVYDFAKGTEYCTDGTVRVTGDTAVATAVAITGPADVVPGNVVQGIPSTAPENGTATVDASGAAMVHPTTAPTTAPQPVDNSNAIQRFIAYIRALVAGNHS